MFTIIVYPWTRSSDQRPKSHLEISPENPFYIHWGILLNICTNVHHVAVPNVKVTHRGQMLVNSMKISHHEIEGFYHKCSPSWDWENMHYLGPYNYARSWSLEIWNIQIFVFSIFHYKWRDFSITLYKFMFTIIRCRKPAVL
jgi:hypothetical protein